MNAGQPGWFAIRPRQRPNSIRCATCSDRYASQRPNAASSSGFPNFGSLEEPADMRRDHGQKFDLNRSREMLETGYVTVARRGAAPALESFRHLPLRRQVIKRELLTLRNAPPGDETGRFGVENEIGAAAVIEVLPGRPVRIHVSAFSDLYRIPIWFRPPLSRHVHHAIVTAYPPCGKDASPITLGSYIYVLHDFRRSARLLST